MRSALLALLAVVLLTASPVRAQEGTPPAKPSSPRARQPPPRTPIAARLDYSLGPGAGNCPDEAYLRQEVARRMGRDLLAPDAVGVPIGRVRVVLARSAQGLTGTYDFFDTSDARQWTRTYSEPSTVRQACRDINQGIAVELASEFTIMEIELARAPAPTREPPPPPEPAPATAPTPPPAAQPEPAPLPVPAAVPRSPRMRVEVGAGGRAAFNLAPAAAVGVFGHLGLQVFAFGRSDAWISAAIEGSADAPSTGHVERGVGIKANLLAGSALTCGHWDLFSGRTVVPSLFGCMLGTVGILHAAHEGPATGGASSTSTYAGVGPRVGIEARVAPFVALRIHGTVLGTVHAASAASSGGRLIWETPAGSADVGIGVIFLLGGAKQ